MVELGPANSMTTNQWAKKWFQQLFQGVSQFLFCDNNIDHRFCPNINFFLNFLSCCTVCSVHLWFFLLAKRCSMQETGIVVCAHYKKMHYLSKLWQSSELSTMYACYVVCTKTFTNIVSPVIWIMYTQCKVDIESFATQLQHNYIHPKVGD